MSLIQKIFSPFQERSLDDIVELTDEVHNSIANLSALTKKHFFQELFRFLANLPKGALAIQSKNILRNLSKILNSEYEIAPSQRKNLVQRASIIESLMREKLQGLRPEIEPIALHACGKTLFVARQTLSSNVFNAMLDGSFAEAQERRVLLDGITQPEAFQAVVSFFHGEKCELQTKTFSQVFTFAQAYNFPDLCKKCQEFAQEKIRKHALVLQSKEKFEDGIMELVHDFMTSVEEGITQASGISLILEMAFYLQIEAGSDEERVKLLERIAPEEIPEEKLPDDEVPLLEDEVPEEEASNQTTSSASSSSSSSSSAATKSDEKQNIQELFAKLQKKALVHWLYEKIREGVSLQNLTAFMKLYIYPFYKEFPHKFLENSIMLFAQRVFEEIGLIHYGVKSLVLHLSEKDKFFEIFKTYELGEFFSEVKFFVTELAYPIDNHLEELFSTIYPEGPQNQNVCPAKIQIVLEHTLEQHVEHVKKKCAELSKKHEAEKRSILLECHLSPVNEYFRHYSILAGFTPSDQRRRLHPLDTWILNED